MSKSLEYHEVAREDGVHVLAERCPTCIFHPGNLMDLERGRVRGMVEECVRIGGTIPCHSTIRRGDGVKPAICRGFYDSKWGQRIQLLVLATVMGVIKEDPVPEEEL